MTACISFDVGIRNLGVAVVRHPGRECIYMGVWDLETNQTTEAIETLCKKLARMWPELETHGVTFACIEQQPERQHVSGGRRQWGGGRDNTQMKSIAHALQAYFLARNMEVFFVSPRSKMTVYQGPPVDIGTRAKSEYTIRKKTAIAHAKAILSSSSNARDNEWALFLTSLDKADDASDAFLQACYALEHRPNLVPL